MFYDELPTETWYIFDGVTHDAIGEVLATDEDDALEIAAGTFFDYPSTKMYAIAHSEF